MGFNSAFKGLKSRASGLSDKF